MAILLSLGANLGNRMDTIRRALDMLDATMAVRLVRVSPVYETEPVGELDQDPFLNLAAEIETAITPLELLNVAKQIESQLGRAAGPRWGPRIIDIDLILWADTVLDTNTLTLPHKEFRTRAFVLQPLLDIAPHARDPITGLTVAELAAGPDVAGKVLRWM